MLTTGNTSYTLLLLIGIYFHFFDIEGTNSGSNHGLTVVMYTVFVAMSAQAAGAGMEGRRPGRSRDQHGDGRETSSLEAAGG